MRRQPTFSRCRIVFTLLFPKERRGRRRSAAVQTHTHMPVPSAYRASPRPVGVGKNICNGRGFASSLRGRSRLDLDLTARYDKNDCCHSVVREAADYASKRSN